MIPTATTTATTMIANSLTMPTAVITESSENTTSSNRICTMTPVNDTVAAAPRSRRWAPLRPPTARDLGDRGHQKGAAHNRIRSRPDISIPTTLNSGAVSQIAR